MLWLIGNTTIRTPYRLREALTILQNPSLNGNLVGEDQESAFAAALNEKKIVNLKRPDKFADLGRKWRVALSQLGFITPKLLHKRSVIKSEGFDAELLKITKDISDLSGKPYEVTPNGIRLINSELITSQQECFLRSLAAYKIPSDIEKRYKCTPFSPLKFVIDIFDELEKAGENPIISFSEFSFFVQTNSPDYGVKNVVSDIAEYRKLRGSDKQSKKKIDKGYCEKITKKIDIKKDTLGDYADTSLRYLKATGLFMSSGRGISLSLSRQKLINLLRLNKEDEASRDQYFLKLWKGASLPTDNIDSSRAIISDLVNQLSKRGVNDVARSLGSSASIQEIELERHRLEDILLKLDEKEYAANQKNCIEEIIQFMECIGAKKKSFTLSNGSEVEIPSGEAPAYLEWIIWRAFLAINSLHNMPWEARRFNIDQDFLPTGTAPGNGPDMVFEFEEVIVVVEVTLTTSSRQEAAEGETVRRHVAKYAEEKRKEVYGLFIALAIDNNTAHTFRVGDWYCIDETKITLDIVPITLNEFLKLMISAKERLEVMPQVLKEMLTKCRSKANQDAPRWKKAISDIIENLSKKTLN